MWTNARVGCAFHSGVDACGVLASSHCDLARDAPSARHYCRPDYQIPMELHSSSPRHLSTSVALRSKTKTRMTCSITSQVPHLRSLPCAAAAATALLRYVWNRLERAAPVQNGGSSGSRSRILGHQSRCTSARYNLWPRACERTPRRGQTARTQSCSSFWRKRACVSLRRGSSASQLSETAQVMSWQRTRMPTAP
jgi:hypothetical protein